MKIRHIIPLVITALSLVACVPSINPFYSANQVVSEPRLLGEWLGKEKSDEGTLWNFVQNEKSYKLTITDKDGKQGEFKAMLFKLKDHYYLDLIPSNCKFAENQADLVALAIFPGHLLVRIVQLEPSLKMAFFDFEWLTKYLEKEPAALAHHSEDDHVVLTAETRDLQQFVLQHLEEGLFQKPSEYQRQTRPTPDASPAK